MLLNLFSFLIRFKNDESKLFSNPYLRQKFRMAKLSPEKFESALNNSPLSSLCNGDRTKLYDIHEFVKFNRSQEVFRSHAQGKCLYIVEHGTFTLYLKDGRSKILTEGNVFGEMAALTDFDRLGTVVAMGNESSLIAFTRPRLESSGMIPQTEAPSLFQLLFKNTVSYMNEMLDDSTETLLMKGEGERSEFKEGEHNPNILKAIAGFLNTNGGTVLLGVADNGDVVGIDDYSNASADKYDQDFQNLIREKMNSEAMSFIHFSHSCFNGKGVYRMDVAPSDRPVYAKIGKGVASESFYIRSGATNQHLGFGAALKYIVRRFPHELLND